MSNQNPQPQKKSQTQTTTFGPHTTSVTVTKARVGSSQNLSKSETMNGKICGVCQATYDHELKCPNKQLLLEGSKRPHAK